MRTARLILSGMFAALPAVESSAHVILNKTDAKIGAPYKAVLVIPHGCEGSATTRLTVTIPEGMIAVKPLPKPGWKIDVVKGGYQRTYAFMHGMQVSEGVKEITWTGRLDDGFYDEFAFAGFIADSLKDGERLAFPAVQQCEVGSASWSEVAAAGQDPHSLKFPAPLLRLAAAEGAKASVSKGDITVTAPWSRATPGGAKVGGGYLTIQNKGAAADRLIGASTDAASTVEVHEMTMNNGVMTMRPVEGGLVVPPGQTVALSPGGYHLMLMGLKGPLSQGRSVTVTLEFEHAGKISVDFEVLGVGAQGPGTSAQAPGGETHDHTR
jgi:copper(I)-binding protein